MPAEFECTRKVLCVSLLSSSFFIIFKKRQRQNDKLLLAYKQMSQSFSVTMLVAMTAVVITFERTGDHAKRHPPDTEAEKVKKMYMSDIFQDTSRSEAIKEQSFDLLPSVCNQCLKCLFNQNTIKPSLLSNCSALSILYENRILV